MKNRLPLLVGLVAIAAIIVIGALVINGKKSNNNDMHMSTGSSSSDSNTGTDNAVATDKVSIKDFAFSPSVITVKKGTKVTWTNNDTTTHNVDVDESVEEASAEQFNSGDLLSGKSYSYTFTKTGTYRYHCNFHPSMHGIVIVTE